MKYIYKLIYSGKINIKIDEQNNVLELGSDMSVDYKISLLKESYERMNNIQNDLIGISFNKSKIK